MSSDDDNGPPQKRSRIDATPKGSCFQTPEYDEMETEDQQPSQSGQTMLDECKWIRFSGARYWLRNMVTVGRDHDGAKFVVGRAKHAGDLLPAKAKPEHGVAYVSYDGLEHIKHDFEILMSAKFNWIPSRNGNVPAEAIKAGITDKGETLFVGRCLHNGVPVIGKVHPSHCCLFAPYDGKELRYKQYDTLVRY